MEEHVRKQHYVLQYLLRNLCSGVDKPIWRYNKTWMNSKERGISNIAQEEYCYDTVPGQKEGSFEYTLSSSESDDLDN
jgi:hypothetical protein